MTAFEKLIERGMVAKRESKYVDFKEQIDLTSTRDWCEFVKDVVAMANTGGGIILVGLKNDGTPSGHDVTEILEYDPADVTNRMTRYINEQFSNFEIREIKTKGHSVAAFVIAPADIPLVFSKPGTYPIGSGKQATAFAQGTVYFRHGAKSEPGTTLDLRRFVEREVERIRKSWFENVRKVVRAAPGSVVSVMEPQKIGAGGTVRGRIVGDPNAPGFVPQNADEIWPYRQMAVIKRVNDRLRGKTRINSHDIQCVRRVHDIDKKYPKFVYRPYRKSAPQYSDEFIGWLVTQYQRDAGFFRKARDAVREEMQKKS